MQKNFFRGMSAFPLTPADEIGRVDTANYSSILERLVSAKVDSITVLGSTGIYTFLNRTERRRVIETAVKTVGGRIPVMAGIGALRTNDVLDLARDAQSAGASGLLLAPVSYFPLREEEVFQHFLAVSQVTDLPICIYNNPGTTNFKFSYSLVERLAKIPNVVALKNPLAEGNDFQKELAALRLRLPGHFTIGYSGDSGCATSMLEGADAFYSVLGGTLPKPFLMLTRAAQAKDAKEAYRIDEKFQPLWSLFPEFGSIRVTYAVANLLNITHAKPPRPVLPVPDADMKRVSAALDTLSQLGSIV